MLWDWEIVAHISLGEALLILPMFVLAFIVGSKMTVGTNKKPERMILAKEFVNYYQDRTAELLKQYRVLKATGVRTEAFYKLERDMTATFQGFIVAYEKQLEKVVDADVMNMDAEMKVARQVMHEDGIDYESSENCSNMANAMPDEVKVTMPKPEIPKKSTGKGINFKYVGAAAMGVVLGAVGLYKFLERSNEI